VLSSFNSGFAPTLRVIDLSLAQPPQPISLPNVIMELHPELLEAMEALALKFGVSACREAVGAVSYSPAVQCNEAKYKRKSSSPSQSIFFRPHEGFNSEDALRIIEQESSWNENLRLCLDLSDEDCGNADAILRTFQHCYNRRCKWASYYGTQQGYSTFQEISISCDNKLTRRILDDPSIAIFQELRLCSIEFAESPIPKAIMSRTHTLVCNGGSVQELTLADCCMNANDMFFVKKMLLSNNLRLLSLRFITLSAARRSIEHLAQGFEELRKMANKGTVIRLHSLIMDRLEGVPGRPLKIRSRLLRSLRGLPSLKTLHLQESCDSIILPSVLGEDVLLHPHLLHPMVAPSIPLGLWPLVLQKAANIRGEGQHRLKLDGTWGKEILLELDGAYYMVQGLSQRGILPPAGTTMTTPNRKRVGV
jgi:hypothetical protein